ncbi:MAG: S1C family serine protease [Actinomycetota bacterium]|nr:S1C family serine protease [Actinomycetota bacterium]
MRFAGTRWATLVVAAALFAAACGGGAEETTTTTTTVVADNSTTTVTEPTTPNESSGAVSGLKGVRGAVVRIVAEGSFVDIEEGLVNNAAGSGSGFIIDPSGLAVTNNHVVTGAAFLQVYIEGEDEPRNAKILGVSECSDLAVIDIDGAGFPFLDWYDDDITTGTDVYAAGFPLGDPEYTLTEGIVSKEKADGESNWASIDSVIEHTAQILPGNSGGPLISEDGQVIGVNYASWNDLDIQYAISRDEVAKILDDLIAGNDVDSIGVNGTAVLGDDLSGVWVAATESGSAAANLGITGGDIITEMEGLTLATDGTMADYCDILRSHESDDPLTVEILRFGTEEVLEGTLNGDEELIVAFSFADELGDEVGDDSAVTYEYTEVFDDDGVLVMQIPTTWLEIDGSGWNVNDEIVGPRIVAAPNLAAFYDTWTTPGVFFGASVDLLDELEPSDLLDLSDFSDSCVYDDTYDYEDAVYTGAYDLWLNCGGTDTAFVVLEAYPEAADFVVYVQIQIVTDADLEALDVILATFDVVSG